MVDVLRSAWCSSVAARKTDWGQEVMLFKIGMPSVRPHPDAGRRTQKGGFFVSEANSAATHTPYGLAKNEVDT